ncbi:MAG: hypothetical protein PVJ67_04510 [Candidatus Pacearchaeota archaeon]|jgi:hypothetical protein
MNLQFYLEKLFTSLEFEEFRRENPDSYFASGFVVIDKEGKEKDKVHIDYFIESTKKMFSFQLENDCEKVPIEQMPEIAPIKINDNVDFDFSKIEEMILEKMENENVKSKVQRILLSLQNKDKKNFLIGTVFISNLAMLKITIDLEEEKIIDFEKKSFMDMFKVLRKGDRK